MKTLDYRYRNKNWLASIFIFVLFSLLSGYFSTIAAQDCPPNIDFETGSFSGWTCYTGTTAAIGNSNSISLVNSGYPVSNRHTMYSSNTDEVDYYGGFPVSCPNGSGHSIRLGNNLGGGEAEGVSYEFTIPSNDNNFSLVYNYAVVFQSPNHKENEQPRMEIEITNVTDSKLISCASFSFVAVGRTLPGFLVSSRMDTTTVMYKNWSAVSVDLSGNAGKTIRLFFKTADCTFKKHFGYAYIDVNTECSGKLTGAIFCPDDHFIKVIAPYGYQNYTWYDSSLSVILGNEQTMTFTPPPKSGTRIAVKLQPYEGYGCPNTLFTYLSDSLKVISDAGQDKLSCNQVSVNIGTINTPGIIYKWNPVTGLSNPTISNPLASPDTTTRYVVSTSNIGGGCPSTDTVIVKASVIDSSLQLLGKAIYCMNNGDSAVLIVHPTSSIQWYRNGYPIEGATNISSYRVLSDGDYHAVLGNTMGCSINTTKIAIVIDKAKIGITYPVVYALVNSPITLKARPIGDQILWKQPISLNNPTSFTPIFKGNMDRQYLVEITTNTDCHTVDTQFVKTIANIDILIPSAFTPNNDGKNDILRPLLKGISEFHFFRIFNRWGQLIFETNIEQNGWDGSFKGLPLSTQTVVWMVKIVGLDGQLYLKKGTSILIK